jgi:hypothetical protein
MTPLINFDIIYHYKQDKALDIILKEIIEKKSKYNFDKIVGFMLLEVTQPNDIDSCCQTLEIIKQKCRELGVTDFYIVANYPYKQYQKQLEQFNIIYFEAFSYCVYNSYKLKPKNLSTSWNKDADKFLFLNAIPSRLNRIKLLSMYWKKSMLSKCVWSLFRPYSEIIERDCRAFTSDLTDNEYEEFMKIAVRRLDDVPSIDFKMASLTCPTDWTIDKQFYQETNLSVISETFFKNNQPLNDLSEKTWRAIINHHPFIIAGTVGIRKCLESLGFKTFVEYLKYDYDNFENYDQRLSAIVDNTKYFLENCNRYQNQINDDIEHNYQQYLKLIEQNKQTIEYLNINLGVDKTDLDSIFNLPNYIPLTNIDDIKALDDQQVERDKKINNLS